MDKSGILLIDKPAGPSSAHVLRLISRQLALPKELKIGHAGTLDPFATGLLVVLLGKATRLADYFQAGGKIYSGIIQFGITTDSDDITGAVIAKNDKFPESVNLQSAANSFLGQIQQMPPAISALKINGKRAYQLKRAGIEPELKARAVRLDSIEVNPKDPGLAAFKISCSKGFYVRSLARDLGHKVGCGACLKALRREASWPFNVADATTIEQLESLEKSAFISLDAALEKLAFIELMVEDWDFERLQNGLIPKGLESTFKQKLDSTGQGLIVYKRISDQQAGGLVKVSGAGDCSETEISILMNF